VLVEEPTDVQGLPKRSVLGRYRPSGSGVFRRYQNKPVRFSGAKKSEDEEDDSGGGGCQSEFESLLSCTKLAEQTDVDEHDACAQYRLNFLLCLRKEKVVNAVQASRRYNFMRVLNSCKKLSK